jgi:phage gp29-like protein
MKTLLPNSYAAQGRALPPRRDIVRAAVPIGMGADMARIVQPAAAGRWLMPSTSQITPQYLETILRGALAGSPVQQWELFDLMEDTWPRLLKNANELKRAVVMRDWECESWHEEDAPPETEADDRRALVSNAVWKMRPNPAGDENGFQQTIYDILDAWLKGTSVLEIEWEARQDRKLGKIIAPRCTHWVHPSNYAWTDAGWLGLAPGSSSFVNPFSSERKATPFPEDKFLIAICKAKTGHPLAGALLRPLAFWWCAANFTSEWFLNFAQIFGLPIRWANYDPNVPGLVDKVCDMLENMGSAAWGAFPAGTTLDIKDAPKGGTDNPQVALLDRADKQCDILILGQTLTTDTPSAGGGTRAQGEVHLTVRDQIIESCCDFAENVINNQLVPMILRLNYGDTELAPEFCAEPETIEDEKANAERDQILLGQGVELPKAWFYKRHNIPLPAAGDEVIAGRAPQPAGLPGAGFGSPSPGGEGRGEGGLAARHAHVHLHAADATSKIVDAALEDLTGVEARWLGGVKPFFHQLIAAAQSKQVTDEDFVKLLAKANQQMPELFNRMKPEELATALENAMSAAVVNGAVRGSLNRKVNK